LHLGALIFSPARSSASNQRRDAQMPIHDPNDPVADSADEDKQTHLEGGLPTDADNRVGYCRPPKHRRFQPGQTGNLGGRPVGVKSLSDIVRKIVGQKITITENGRTRRVPRLEAILLRAASEASRGDAASLRLLLQLAERYGESAQTGVERETTAAEDLAILRRYLPDLTSVPPEALGLEANADVKRGL
jgi:Family of unknown function (DUF5681)